ncbi:hypothetical protein [Tellurirhabdus bombi]|uniref:hypothetical protein n=1 Tax=Tellurirhabdus bombi TaxID=2907205 RepID=UPI001F23E110|nr:hypothetical protein [Tellurirhabdus bombi]
MKTRVNSLYTVVLFLLITLPSFAQRKPTPQPSKDGYWVVETVPGAERKTTAYFYNQTHTLIYRENLKTTRINLRRSKTLAHFNTVLEQALRQYSTTQQLASDQNWVAVRIR